MPTLRKSQRVPLSCTECARRKLRCSKTIPCSSCIDRGKAATCQRETVQVVNKRDRERRVNLSSHSNESRRAESASPDNVSPGTNDAERWRAPNQEESLQTEVSSNPTTSVPASETAVTLEFLTHGRRHILDLYGTKPADHPSMATPSPSSGTLQYGEEEVTCASIWDMVLSADEARQLLEYHRSMLAWMHNVVHMPTFMEEFERSLKTQPDARWVALYYAILSTTLYHMDNTETAKFGLALAEKVNSARSLYDKSVQQLFETKFMARPSVTSVQTICVLMQVAHNIDESDFISVMIASGIRLCQCLNLHRLGPDRSLVELGDRPTEIILRTLVEREVKKRVWWFLVRQDWLQIPYQNTYLIHPTQFNTPLPLNCHEVPELAEDSFILKSFPEDMFTLNSYLNATSKMAIIIWKQQDRMCNSGHPGTTAQGMEKLYEQVLWADTELKQAYATLPKFLKTTNAEVDLGPGVPSFIHNISSALLLSIAHKTWTIHRHFILQSFHDRRFSYSQMSCIAIAERCILDTETWNDDAGTQMIQSLWTVVAHTTCCAIILALASMFRAGNELLYDAPKIRRLAERGRELVRKFEVSSSIARRGIVVIDSLLNLEDTTKMPEKLCLNVEAIVRQVCSEDTAGRQNEDCSENGGFAFPMGVDNFDNMFSTVEFDVMDILKNIHMN